ncbi:MAG TPA: hypothetical protein VN730_05120 [Steroidobacteraceae bacterium]|nr:hypothetical protein [Steroidobacteraceae bacterium]
MLPVTITPACRAPDPCGALNGQRAPVARRALAAGRVLAAGRALAACIVACALLAACGSPSSPTSAQRAASSLAHLKAIGIKRSSAAHKTAKPAAPGSADLVAAIAGDKSPVPVEVRYALRQRPEVGKPVELDVEVTPTGPLGRLVTSFHVEDGLSIENGGAASETDRPAPGVPLSRALTIVAQRDGIFYVSATVLVDAGADSVARTFTIPVIAGAGTS